MQGCDRGMFQVAGSVASAGGELGTWRSAPLGCSRDPFDGKPVETTASVATFLWEDPSMHDKLRDKHRPMAPDAPMRLELARRNNAVSASLTTVKIKGTLLQPGDCTRLQLDTQERPAAIPGGRPTLGGLLTMDCNVRGSHVTADFSFRRCEF